MNLNEYGKQNPKQRAEAWYVKALTEDQRKQLRRARKSGMISIGTMVKWLREDQGLDDATDGKLTTMFKQEGI